MEIARRGSRRSEVRKFMVVRFGLGVLLVIELGAICFVIAWREIWQNRPANTSELAGLDIKIPKAIDENTTIAI